MKHIHEERTSVELLSGGMKIFGILHMPKKAKAAKVPAVLFCHGFGGNKSGKFRLSVRQAEKLSEEGFASFRIDFRGSGDSEGDFSDTTIETEFEDAKCALDYLLNHPDVDPERIAIIGRSLGGAIATKLAASFERTKAVILWCPLFDAKPWIEAHKNRPISFMGQKLSDETIRQFRELDLRDSLTALATTPMLIVRACMDEILSVYHHDGYLDARKESMHTDELLLANSSHDFSDCSEQEELLTKTTSFLREKL